MSHTGPNENESLEDTLKVQLAIRIARAQLILDSTKIDLDDQERDDLKSWLQNSMRSAGLSSNPITGDAGEIVMSQEGSESTAQNVGENEEEPGVDWFAFVEEQLAYYDNNLKDFGFTLSEEACKEREEQVLKDLCLDEHYTEISKNLAQKKATEDDLVGSVVEPVSSPVLVKEDYLRKRNEKVIQGLREEIDFIKSKHFTGGGKWAGYTSERAWKKVENIKSTIKEIETSYNLYRTGELIRGLNDDKILKERLVGLSKKTVSYLEAFMNLFKKEKPEDHIKAGMEEGFKLTK